MNKFFYTKNQLRVFLIICMIFTAPFAFLMMMGAIENESGLIMMIPFLAGFPWVFVYLLFDIPGFTTPKLPGASGRLTILEFILFMLPVYINIYLIIRLLIKNSKSHKK